MNTRQVDAKTLIAHAFAVHQAGDLAQADALYSRMLAAMPGHPQISYFLGALRIQQGRNAEALPLLTLAHKANPRNASVVLHIGNALQELGRFEEAVAQYDAALTLKPDFADAANNRGNALRALGRMDAALASFDAALALAPADANIWYNKGGLLQIMGRQEEAVAAFDRAIALRPDHAESHSNKGNALTALRKPALALPCFERAIALKPDLFEAYFFYGRNCFNRGQYAKAAELFGKAADFKLDDFRSLGLQSMCFQSLGKLEEARASAKAALARTEAAVAERPDDADALAFGAGLLAALGENDRTRDWAERASIIEPDDFYMHYNIACAYAILGEKELALDRLERIMGPSTLRSLQEFIMHDSDLDVLREHPRFVALLKRLGERE